MKKSVLSVLQVSAYRRMKNINIFLNLSGTFEKKIIQIRHCQDHDIGFNLWK